MFILADSFNYKSFIYLFKHDTTAGARGMLKNVFGFTY